MNGWHAPSHTERCGIYVYHSVGPSDIVTETDRCLPILENCTYSSSRVFPLFDSSNVRYPRVPTLYDYLGLILAKPEPSRHSGQAYRVSKHVLVIIVDVLILT